MILSCEKRPSLQLLLDCEEANGDGGGIAWIGNDSLVHWRKGISAKTMLCITNSAPLPFVCHFRIGTVGSTDARLCHPFPVTKDASTATHGKAQSVVFQNGHWNDWQQSVLMATIQRQLTIPNDKLWSDTRAIAILIAVYGERILPIIPAGKLALVSAKTGITLTDRYWPEAEKGIVASNTDYKIDWAKYKQAKAYLIGDIHE